MVYYRVAICIVPTVLLSTTATFSGAVSKFQDKNILTFPSDSVQPRWFVP